MEDEAFVATRDRGQMLKRVGSMLNAFGTYYGETFLNKSVRRKPSSTSYDWVMTTISNPNDCYDMFRMSRPLIEKLHDLLILSYGLKTTENMCSLEALCMFL